MLGQCPVRDLGSPDCSVLQTLPYTALRFVWGKTVMSATGVLSAPGFLARERTIAGPGFSRWLIPPSALAIHLCIGMAYGFSVFWLPLSKAVGIGNPIKCPADMGLFARAVSSTCDWRIPELQ